MLENFGKKSLPIVDVDLYDLENFIDVSLEEINLCGVYGDPIYHRNFEELVQLAKRKAKKLLIITNGGHRTKSWWQSIVKNFSPEDKIIFSIDGTPENFIKYRINGDWESTLIALKECVASPIKTVWKYIPFSFNENDIEAARQLALNIGIDEFEISYSDRWENNDWLKPTGENLIGNRSQLRDAVKNKNQPVIKIDPLCSNHREHYISALGYYMPCCFVADHRFYYKSQWWKNQTMHKIKNTTLSTQLEIFNNFYKKINVDNPDYCIFNCGKC
jgi:MoaA/NifB/PqqE/SkfB family radical SAM enzyme